MLVSSGLVQKWRQREHLIAELLFNYEHGLSLEQLEDQFQTTFNLKQIGIIFVLYSIGIGFSLLAFIIELFFIKLFWYWEIFTEKYFQNTSPFSTKYQKPDLNVDFDLAKQK